MNNNLNISHQNLQHSSFATADIKQSQIAQTVRHNSKGISVENGKNSRENFIHWNQLFHKEIFLAKKITIFLELEIRKPIRLFKSKCHCWVSPKSLTHFSNGEIVNYFPKLFIYLGLVVIGASWRHLLRNPDTVTETPIYNQLLKSINERRQQKKLIEEKEYLKVLVA